MVCSLVSSAQFIELKPVAVSNSNGMLEEKQYNVNDFSVIEKIDVNEFIIKVNEKIYLFNFDNTKKFAVKYQTCNQDHIRIFPNKDINIICDNTGRFCVKRTDCNGFRYKDFRMAVPGVFWKIDDLST